MEGKNSSAHLALDFVQYWFKSVNAHGIHSPFVYEWVQNVLYDRTPYYPFTEIEKLRQSLRGNLDQVERTDFGAGSRTKKITSVASIAQSQLVSAKFGELLFKLALRSQANNILEMGSSLGISTAYLSTANTDSNVVSFEGDPAIALLAKENLKQLKIENASIWEGKFDELLPAYLQQCESVDLVYLDGNHTYDATISYLSQILPKLHQDSVVILDDIRWSKGMEKAWREVREYKEVGISIDLFRMGILFFKQDQRKQNFMIRY